VSHLEGNGGSREREVGGRAVRWLVRPAVGGCPSPAVVVNQVNLLVVWWLVSERHVGGGK